MSDVDEGADIEPSRKNGWTWPPHPLQLVAWALMIVFSVMHFCILAPSIHKSWQPAVYIVSFIG